TIWEREEPADTIPFEVNDKLLGLLTRRGKGQLIEMETGDTFATFQVEMPQRLQAIACLLVEGTYLVLVSGPVEDEQLVSAPQPRQGYRHPFVTGSFTAIDSATGEIRWQRPFDETVVSIDQPKGLPIFVAAAARKFSPKEGAPHGGRVTVFDVRTGKELVRSESEYPMGVLHAVDGFLEERKVTVRTRYELIELQYGSSEDGADSDRDAEDGAGPGNAEPSLNKSSS
ncbi:Outer membrane protein assembly factor BamB, partial [Durusdinium trenchii]